MSAAFVRAAVFARGAAPAAVVVVQARPWDLGHLRAGRAPAHCEAGTRDPGPGRQPTVQAEPLRVNAVGPGFAAPRDAVKPRVTEPAAGRDAV
ncbi:hypothetical protein SUDANB58_00591 [Streptomyces sp. enrichment culture]